MILWKAVKDATRREAEAVAALLADDRRTEAVTAFRNPAKVGAWPETGVML
jgi:hypothetical protein